MGFLDPPTYSRTQADGRYAPKAEVTRQLRAVPGMTPVTNRCAFGSPINNQSNGTDTGGNSNLYVPVNVAFTGMRLVYDNFNTLGTGESDPTNSITVRAAVQLADGTNIPVYFNGKRDVTIEAGGVVVTDHIGVNHTGPTAASPYLFVRTYVTCTSGGKWPLNGIVSNSVWNAAEGWESGTSITDKTTSGTITTAATYYYGPAAVLGVTKSRNAIIGLVGDSIMTGREDGTGTGSKTKDWGFAARALSTANLCSVRVANSTETFAIWNAFTTSRRRRAYLDGVTHIVCNYGANEIGGGTALATIQANAIAAWTTFSQYGAIAYQTTVTPRTTSTDSWVTTGNQTVTANETLRVNWNNWLRDGAPISAGAAVAVGTGGASRCAVYDSSGALVTAASGAAHLLGGVFEIADCCETARNSGLWKVNGSTNYGTFDGLHPCSPMHVLMQAAIPTSLFT